MRTDATVPIVSLRGVPGVGKTAIALEYAYRSAAVFPDGCFWLDARSGDAESALRIMLVTSGVAGSDELGGKFDDICRLWRTHSDGRRLLLVIDNAEKLVAGQPDLLSRLYPSAPARTLITSRVTVDASRDIRIDILSEDDALALLEEHGVDVAAQRAEAAALARRLGYLALALNITAQRMAIFTPKRTCAQALADLERSSSILDQLRLPRTDGVDGNAAQSFALSYTMLDEILHDAFHALGSCAPSGAPVSALAALLDTDESEAQDLALALGALSLAECDGARVELHPLLHEYARVRLHSLPEQEQRLFVRHVAYFGQSIGGAYQRAVNEDRGSNRDVALALFDRERDNVELAQVRALADGFPDLSLAVEVTDDLTGVWRLRDEERLLGWLTNALALATAAGLTHRQANVRQAIGDVQSFRDDKDAALASYDEALRLFTEVGAKLGQANVRQAIGDVQSFRDDKDAALASYDEALRLFTEVGAKLGQANVRKAIGDVQSFRKEMDAALASYDEALRLFTEVGAKLGQANVRLAQGRLLNNVSLLEQALELYEAIRDGYSIARCKLFLGVLCLQHGDGERGVRLLQEARELWEQIDFTPGIEAIERILRQVRGTAQE